MNLDIYSYLNLFTLDLVSIVVVIKKHHLSLDLLIKQCIQLEVVSEESKIVTGYPC